MQCIANVVFKEIMLFLLLKTASFLIIMVTTNCSGDTIQFYSLEDIDHVFSHSLGEVGLSTSSKLYWQFL